jgi:hypothetical protein
MSYRQDWLATQMLLFSHVTPPCSPLPANLLVSSNWDSSHLQIGCRPSCYCPSHHWIHHKHVLRTYDIHAQVQGCQCPQGPHIYRVDTGLND